jgi:protein arginine N-methyltransferase 1
MPEANLLLDRLKKKNYCLSDSPSFSPFCFEKGPHAAYTHWKQTVFYLDDVLSMKKGEEIRGEFSCRPNKKNPRDQDFVISYVFEGEYDKIEHSQEYFLH